MSQFQLTSEIIRCAMHVHSELGPGLFENIYKECLFYKLSKEGYTTEKEKILPVCYHGMEMTCGYRVDLLVEQMVVVEIKSVQQLSDLYLAQTINYLKLGKFPVGLLFNFNVLHLKDGIKRLINSKD